MKAFAVFCAVLAVAAASNCGCGQRSVIVDGGSSLVDGVSAAASLGNAGVFSSSGVASARLIAPTYRVAVDNCGPKTRRLAPVSARPLTAAPVVGPTVTLPYNVPSPRTVSNRCRCVKTIVKAQPVEQIITVPVIRRFVQTLTRPTYQTINYAAAPVNCPGVEDYARYCA